MARLSTFPVLDTSLGSSHRRTHSSAITILQNNCLYFLNIVDEEN